MESAAGPASEALAVLLQHPPVASDQQNVCTLLQVSKTWRAAVQQSAAGLTDITAKVSRKQHAVLAGLGAWLSSYPSLVRTVSISKATQFYWPEEDIVTARHVLEVGLQLAALGSGARALTQAVACSASTSATQHAWRLESYHSDIVATPAMLAAFPAATLTQLDIGNADTADIAGVTAHLKRLSNLEHLAIKYGWHRLPSESASMLTALSTLRQLTSLDLFKVDPPSLQWLPVQLQQLTVHVSSGLIDLGHLSSLLQLNLYTDGPKVNSVLPAQLQHLTLDSDDEGPLVNLGITKLQQLQHLAINSAISEHATQLLSLTSMPKLLELHLHGQDGLEWSDAEFVYPRLTMLRSLGVREEESSGKFLVEACRIAALAGSITKLHLELNHATPTDSDDDEDDTDVLCVCEHIKGLAHLRDLTLDLEPASFGPSSNNGRGCLAALDVLHLTTLTGLTRLSIQAVSGVDDTVVCALATALKQLQHLSLAAGKLSTAPLPGLGCLSGLRHLDLPPYKSGVAEIGLCFLAGLSRLTYLGGFDSVKEEALNAF